MKRVGDGDPAAAVLDVRGRRGRGPLPRRLSVAVHVAVAATLLGAGAFVQSVFGLNRDAQSSLQWVRIGWFPTLVGLLYVLAWCGWYLMLTVRTRDDSDAKADITRQWKAAKRRMTRAGIDIQRVPLFLTLGRPAGGVHHFFSSGRFPFSLPASPVDEDAPLSVCGDRDGVFVCCNQTSLLGNFLDRFTASAASSAAALGIPKANASRSPGSECRPDDRSEQSPCPTAGAHSPAASPLLASGGGNAATLTQSRPAVATVPLSATVRAMEQRLADLEYQLTLAEATPETDVLAAAESAALLEESLQLDPGVADRLTERLELICRLIAEEREPLCPLNGIVLLVPIQVTDCDSTADEVGKRIEQDLQAVMRIMETEVSVQVVMCGLEACKGADEWLSRCPEETRHRPLGVVLPAPPATETDTEGTRIDKATEWLCNDLLPPLAYGLLRRNASDPLTDRSHQEENRRLHQFVKSMRDRGPTLSRLLHRSTASGSAHWRLRGCFFAATGSDATTGHGFTSGLMPLIHGMQHEVCWLESRRRRDTVHLAVTLGGYSLMALAAVVVAAFIFA